MAAIADIGGLVASVESAESPPETLPVPVQVLWLVHKADFRTEVRFRRCRESPAGPQWRVPIGAFPMACRPLLSSR